jgi:tetratricopeptide (TPR) repeat protein
MLAAAQAVAQTHPPEFSRALESFKSGNYEESSELLERLTRQNPDRGLYWFNLANAYYRLDNLEGATRAYEKVIQLKSPLSSAALFYLAETRIKQDRKPDAQRILKKLTTESLPPRLAQAVASRLSELEGGPPIPQSLTDRAMKFYQEHDYPAALTALDQLTRSKPSGDAFFLKGLTQLRLGDPQGAKFSFEQAQSLSADPVIRSDARNFIHQIREGTWNPDRPYSLVIDLWGDQNSNLFNNGVSETSVSGQVAHASLGFRYRFSNALIEYSPRLDEILNLPEDRLISNFGRFQLLWNRTDWIFSSALSMEHVILGGNSYQLRAGAQLKAERGLGPHILEFKFDYLRGFALSSSYNYLNGDTLGASASWSWLVGSSEIRASLGAGLEAIGDLVLTTGTLPLGNASFGGGVGITQVLQPGLDFDFSVVYFEKSYLRDAQPGSVKRFDTLVSGTALLAYALSPQFRPFTSLSYTSNTSTLGANDVSDMNYHQWLGSIGFTWSYL